MTRRIHDSLSQLFADLDFLGLIGPYRRSKVTGVRLDDGIVRLYDEEGGFWDFSVPMYHEAGEVPDSGA